MLDPHIRTELPPVPKSPGKYSVTFRAPDRHGVFKFLINYKRKGYAPKVICRVHNLIQSFFQLDSPAQFYHCVHRASTSRWIPTFHQCCLAILRWRYKYQCRVFALLDPVAGWRCERNEQEGEGEGRVVCKTTRARFRALIIIFEVKTCIAARYSPSPYNQHEHPPGN